MPKNPQRRKIGYDKTGVLIGFTSKGIPIRRNPLPSEIKKSLQNISKLSKGRREAKYPIRRK